MRVCFLLPSTRLHEILQTWDSLPFYAGLPFSLRQVSSVVIFTLMRCVSLYENIFLIFLFYYFWLHWVFVAACGLSLVVVSGGYSSLQCAGFSLQWLLLLRSTGSRHVGSIAVARGLSSYGLRALERRLSSCGTQA